MDYGARLRRIEKVMSGTPPDENMVIFYDMESAEGYEQRPNEFLIIVDYGEGHHGHNEPA